MSSPHASNTKKISLVLDTGLGFSLPVEMEIPDVMIPLSELVPPMHNLTDGVVSLAGVSAAKKGETVSCKAGCSACCSQLISLTPPEAFFMAEEISRFPKERQNKITERFDELLGAIAEAGLTEKLHTLHHLSLLKSDDLFAVSRDYFALGRPCPFLENKSCSIYGFRPLMCREYAVVTDAKHCAFPFLGDVKVLDVHRSRMNPLVELTARVWSKPQALVPLPLMFEWVRENQPLSNVERPAFRLFEDLFVKIMQMKPAGEKKK